MMAMNMRASYKINIKIIIWSITSKDLVLIATACNQMQFAIAANFFMGNPSLISKSPDRAYEKTYCYKVQIIDWYYF